jgi:hypothetical protein
MINSRYVTKAIEYIFPVKYILFEIDLNKLKEVFVRLR